MKSRVVDSIQSVLIVTFISTLVIAILIALIFILYIPKDRIPFIFILLLLTLNYLLIVNPSMILLFGFLHVRAPADFHSCVEKYSTKYGNQTSTDNLVVHVIEDPGYCAAYFVDFGKTHFVFSSKLVHDWNEIDIESTILYLLELRKSTLPLRDTCILVLATIAERFIITSFMGAALIHLVRSHTQDSVIDVRVVGKMKYAMGYTNMLAKFRQSTEVSSRVPASFGMNALADIAKKSAHQSLYAVHETIDARIEAIRMDPSTNSPTQASGYLSP